MQNEVRTQAGENIRRIRRERNLTQKQLAELALGSTERQPHISSLERGSYPPSLPTLYKLAHALNCRVEDIQPLESYMQTA